MNKLHSPLSHFQHASISIELIVEPFHFCLDVFHEKFFVCIMPDVLQQGWAVEPASRMLTVKKQPIVTQQKVDPGKLQRLTEYVFHLEH